MRNTHFRTIAASDFIIGSRAAHTVRPAVSKAEVGALVEILAGIGNRYAHVRAIATSGVVIHSGAYHFFRAAGNRAVGIACIAINTRIGS